MMASVPGLGWPEYGPDRSSLPAGPLVRCRSPGRVGVRIAAAGAAATADRQPERAGDALAWAGLPGGLGWPGEPRAAVPPRAADHGACRWCRCGAAPTVRDHGAQTTVRRRRADRAAAAEDYPGRLETPGAGSGPAAGSAGRSGFTWNR